MNYQKTDNFKFIDQEKINERCIQYLDFIVNESLPNILSFIDGLFICKSFIRNKINFSFNSKYAYFDFLNTKIKTIFNLHEKFMYDTSINNFLYNLTLKDFADLIEFNNNGIDYNQKLFKNINDAIKRDNKNIRITCKDYVEYYNRPKINLKDFDLENNLNNENNPKRNLNNFNVQNNTNFENNNIKSKINFNENNSNNSSNNLNFSTSETSNNNNNNNLISENDKKSFSNYPKEDNKSIFPQINNSETIIKIEKENEEFIFYERNFYYEKEMKNWFQIANKKLSEN